MYQEVYRLKSQQIGKATDSQEYSALQSQIDALERAANNTQKYTDAQRQAAQATDAVVQAQSRFKSSEQLSEAAAKQAEYNALLKERYDVQSKLYLAESQQKINPNASNQQLIND